MKLSLPSLKLLTYAYIYHNYLTLLTITTAQCIKDEFLCSSVQYHINEDKLRFDHTDEFTIDLQFEMGQVAKNEFEWTSKEGFVANIKKIRSEYEKKRNLTPLKMCILGAPGSGKTDVSAQFAKKYRLSHITLKKVIEEYDEMQQTLQKKLDALQGNKPAPQKDAAVEGEEEPPKEEQPPAEEDENSPTAKLKKTLAEIKSVKDMKDDKGRFKDEALVKIVQWKLSQSKCRNHGWILDGFPKTIAQLKLLAKNDKPEEGAEEVDVKKSAEPRFFPNYVITLNASKDVLINRMAQVAKDNDPHSNEEGFKRRYESYLENNNPDKIDSNVSAFFEEMQTASGDHALLKSIMCDELSVADITTQLLEFIGMPHNYGETAAEKAEKEAERIKKETEEKKKQQQEADAQKKKQATDKQEREQIRSQDENRLKEIERQEQEMLQVKSEPLRKYLLDNVIPILTKGLIEVCQVQPEDPVDYLARWLFTHSSDANPQS